MSALNTECVCAECVCAECVCAECICVECKQKEKSHLRYSEAKQAGLEEIKKSNYNYAGLVEKEKMKDKFYE